MSAKNRLLADLALKLRAEHKSFEAHLGDGYLDAAFVRCITMQKQLDGIMEMLNDIRYRGGKCDEA
jgi:hypothetical protein